MGKEAPLSGYRALDLADERGCFCGKILGDFGVDVIKIERPGGDLARNIGPFYHNIPHPEKSLYWFAFNTSKRGITLDIETSTGGEIFLRLVKGADFVIESYRPRHMQGLGLGYEVLSQINPRIIMTSITPFGQTGPYRDYQATDLILMALSGLMFTTGDPDRPPLRISVPQAYLHGGVNAAVGTLIAHYYRELTGEGQLVDVSIEQSAMLASIPSRVCWDCANIIVQREGNKRRVAAGPRTQTIWRCKDGQIVFTASAGLRFGKRLHRLTEWMENEGMAGNLIDVEWEAVDMVKLPQEQLDHWERLWAKFFAAHTKAELYEGAARRGILLTPSNTAADVVADPQLASRGYLVKLDHPELNTSIIYPGIPCTFTESRPCLSRRAPLIGEHNREVYQEELGLSKAELICLKEANVI